MFVGIFGFNFFEEDQATTTISIEPQKTNFTIEEDIAIDITVASRAPLNALEARLQFPPEHLQVKELITDSPIIDIWVEEPNFSNEEGYVSFIGGTTRAGGVVGKAQILTVVFTPIKPGTVELGFEHSLVLQSDGEGSDLLEDSVDADFIVRELESPTRSNVVTRETIAEYVIKDTGPPSPDLNNDGEVSIKDVSVFLPSLSQDYDKKKDFNQDGKVNLVDMSIMMSKILGN